MKKSEIVNLIGKNLEVMKEEEINDLIYHGAGDYHFFMDQLGVKSYPKYEDILEKYQLLNNKKCDCKILAHHYDSEYADPYGINKYPYEDECIFCHKKYYNPMGHTVRFDPTKVTSIDKKDYVFIKYSIYRAILKYIEDFKDDDEIDLYECFDEIKKLIRTGLVYYKDDRDINKEDYKVLVLTGSNEIRIDNQILKGRSLDKVSILLEKIKEVPGIQIDLLNNKSSNDYISERGINDYKYNNLEELESVLKELKDNNYDLIIDISNLKELFNGKIQEYNIKDKIKYNKYISIKDIYGLNNEDINNILSNIDDNNLVFLHDYDYDCSWDLSYYECHRFYFYDNGNISYTNSSLLKNIINEVLTNNTKETLNKYKIKIYDKRR